MVDQQSSTPTSTPTSTSTPPAADDWRAARRAERRERLTRRYGWTGPGIGGFVLILMGLIFLAQNFGYPVPDKWWTMFLLIPAGGAFYAAWNAYQTENRMGGEVVAALVGGITLTLLSFAFIFDFDWGTLWPIVLIVIGGGILLRAYWR